MNIDEKTIPVALIDVYCKWVDAANPKMIVDCCSDNARFFQGCRAIPQNASFARKRMHASLKSDRLIDPSIRTILQDGSLYRDIVIVLSVSAIEVGFSDLAAYFGETEFLSAVLLDPRDEVRELAHDFISKWDGLDSDEGKRQAAASRIHILFSRFFARTKDLAVGASSPDRSPTKQVAKDDNHNVMKVLESAQAALVRQKEAAIKEQKRLQDKLDQGKQNISRLQQDLDAMHSQLKATMAELSDAKSKEKELQASLEERIEQGVESELSSNLRKWLEPVRKVEAGLVAAEKSDLLIRVSKVLEQQRGVDRSYGNRAELTRILEDYCRMLHELKDAGLNALRPLPEVLTVASELEQEIVSLRRRLGMPLDQLTPEESSLLTRINAALSHDDLSRVRHFVQQSAEYDLLGGPELHRLYCAIDQKAGLLYDDARKVGKDLLSADTKAPFNLRRAATKGQSFTLFIDGHNVLFSLSDLFRHHFESGAPGAKARTALANCLVRAFDKPGSDVILYFDGNERSEQSLSDQVRVIYSGGTGEHRADDAILKHMGFCVQSVKSMPLCLVTKDADFAREAALMGATIMHPEEFLLLVNVTVR